MVRNGLQLGVQHLTISKHLTQRKLALRALKKMKNHSYLQG